MKNVFLIKVNLEKLIKERLLKNIKTNKLLPQLIQLNTYSVKR